ncbi:hypothetical protein CLV86_2479 [Lacinutrix venerupis]|nr:hypothetical protein CLV86_2479 [Lacinutrix venerupis]
MEKIENKNFITGIIILSVVVIILNVFLAFIN